ncbi:MAG: 6-carboxytetrahydropterin synthase [Phycisphaerales bacterium]|nr:MAG: 6-carboxytetrahydropterin synthase [Phycisphaerales bacterium]
MYELSVQRKFRAAHAITICGEQEDGHEHDWQVTVVVAGRELDEDGLLCDFLVIQRELDRIIGDLNDRDLNATPPFDRLNPTAEHVAKHIAEQAAEALKSQATVSRVTVIEEPGCAATYRMS